MPTADSLICITTERSGIKTAEDWRKAKTPVKLGAIGPGTSGTDDTKLLAAATGFPLQLIEGYKGTADIRIAAETGEVDGTCAFGWQSAKVTWANALKAREVHVVLQTMLESHPELRVSLSLSITPRPTKAKSFSRSPASFTANKGSIRSRYKSPKSACEYCRKPSSILSRILSLRLRQKRRSSRSTQSMERA